MEFAELDLVFQRYRSNIRLKYICVDLREQTLFEAISWQLEKNAVDQAGRWVVGKIVDGACVVLAAKICQLRF